MIEATRRIDPILAILPKARRVKRPGATMWYCRTNEGLPGRALPDGYYLVHNQVTPQRPLGKNGFRAWVQDNADGLAECGCDFGKNKNAKVNRHYRVRSISP